MTAWEEKARNAENEKNQVSMKIVREQTAWAVEKENLKERVGEIEEKLKKADKDREKYKV